MWNLRPGDLEREIRRTQAILWVLLLALIVFVGLTWALSAKLRRLDERVETLELLCVRGRYVDRTWREYFERPMTWPDRGAVEL